MERSSLEALITIMSVPHVGPRRTVELVKLFGSTQAALSAPAGEIAAAISVKLDVARALVQAGKSTDRAKLILDAAAKDQARVVTWWDDDYPKRLKQIPDPPLVLFVRGEKSPLYDWAVAMVGTRAPSDNGRRITLRVSGELAAAGVTVVSGMALGIDSLSHDGALRAGGRTIAVLGSGIDVVYPPSNRKLFERIIAQGAVMTEYPPGTSPDPFHFPRRNRIISGMSVGVVIVEAGLKSGALITARLAVEQGRELFAMPGPAGAPRSAGVNRLIKDGAAHMVESGAEITEHLRSQLAPVLNVSATLALPKMGDSEAAVYALLEAGPMLLDELIRRSNLGAVAVSRLITAMQLKGLIRRYPGAQVGRA